VTGFEDHFSATAPEYSRYRPRYPESLYDFIVEKLPRRELAWDCATGSGQSAVSLARRFARVIATDAAERQIANAVPLDNVEYRVALAEDPGLEDDSVDLVTVSQALHWFDLDRFFAQVRRVARETAWIAAWAYDILEVAPGIDELLSEFYAVTMGPWWPPERRYVVERYETLPFPFRTVPSPPFRMEARWTVDEMLGYLGTWSAVRRCREQTASDPLEALAPELRARWGASTRTFRCGRAA